MMDDPLMIDVRSGRVLRLFADGNKKHKKASLKNIFEWVALHTIDVRSGSFYDEKAVELYGMFAEGVGKSERPIRSMLGLPLKPPGIKSMIDIDELYFRAEVKDITPNWEIKLNANSRLAWNACREEMLSIDEPLEPHLRDSIVKGEVSLGTTRMFPERSHEIFQRHMLPSRVMVHEPRICFGSSECFLTIESNDYDEAWIKPRITQGGSVKYTFSRSYIIHRAILMMNDPSFVQLLLGTKSHEVHSARRIHNVHADNIVRSIARLIRTFNQHN